MYATLSQSHIDRNGQLRGLSEPDAKAIFLEQLKETIKRLPEGNALDLLKGLPKETVRKICEAGVQEEIDKNMPYILIGGAALLIFIIINSKEKKSCSS